MLLAALVVFGEKTSADPCLRLPFGCGVRLGGSVDAAKLSQIVRDKLGFFIVRPESTRRPIMKTGDTNIIIVVPTRFFCSSQFFRNKIRNCCAACGIVMLIDFGQQAVVSHYYLHTQGNRLVDIYA